MSALIICPNCKIEFAPEEAIARTLEKEFQEKFNLERQKFMQQFNNQQQQLDKQKQEFEEKKLKENEMFTERLRKEKELLKADADKRSREEFEVKMKSLLEDSQLKTRQLQELQKKELDLLRDKSALEDKQKDLEFEIEKRLIEGRRAVEEKVLQQANEKFELERKEFQIQMDQQKRLIEEMSKKAHQGSTQLQGEAQELLLEDILQDAFPYDDLCEVVKGKKGADCVLCVRNKFGQDCGKIIFESKRTAGWGKDWIEKLKQDAVNANADVAVLVSQVLPEKMADRFEYTDGIWICSFSDVKLLTASLREGIIHIYNISKNQEGKGDKMQMLYEYMTSNEFASQWRNIREVFRNMQLSIQKERETMERMWKNREKQLDRALLNSNHIMGAIEGIAGKDSIDMNLLENGADNFLDN